jgi:hypothetical protein
MKKRTDNPLLDVGPDSKVSNIMKRESYYLLYGLVVAALLSFIVILQYVDLAVRDHLIEEGGLVESISAIGYFVCAICLSTNKTKIKDHIYLIIILIGFGLRELDFHTRFTSMGIFNIKFYFSQSIPGLEKLIGIFIILICIYIVVNIMRIYFFDFMIGLKRIEPHSIGIMLGVLFLCVSKSLDGLSRKLDFIGIVAASDIIKLANDMEEILELGIPIMFLIAIEAFYHKS